MPKFDIDLSGIDTSMTGGDFAAFPAGEYRMMIVSSDLKKTKAGTGVYLKVQFTHAGGEFSGRHLWQNFNIQNPNPKAVEIALEHLASLSDACGLGRDFLRTDGTEALEGKMVIVDLVRAKAKDASFGDADGFENRVRNYSMANGATPVAALPEVVTSSPTSEGLVDDIPF